MLLKNFISSCFIVLWKKALKNQYCRQTDMYVLPFRFLLYFLQGKIKKQENLWLNFPKCNGYWFREKKKLDNWKLFIVKCITSFRVTRHVISILRLFWRLFELYVSTYFVQDQAIFFQFLPICWNNSYMMMKSTKMETSFIFSDVWVLLMLGCPVVDKWY